MLKIYSKIFRYEFEPPQLKFYRIRYEFSKFGQNAGSFCLPCEFKKERAKCNFYELQG